MPDPGARIRRHGLRARLLHGLNAAAILVLLGTGLAIGDRFPEALVDLAGGHEALNDVHQWLGLAFAAAVLLAILVLARPAWRLLRELGRIRLRHLAWAVAFLRHLLRPSRHPAPAHEGDLDPAERLVLLVLVVASVLACLTGIWIYFSPAAPRWVFILMIRTHIWSAWVILGALAVHVLAGLGILPTHRGILRTMFGDGTLPTRTALRLWPAWTRREAAAQAATGERSRSNRQA